MTEPQRMWLSRKDLAERLGVPETTVKYWSAMRTGPRYAKFGRHVRYRLSDVIAWEDEQFEGPRPPLG